MGQALQRINIIRDVGEDALRGRVYLPVDLLDKHGLKPADVLARTPSAAMQAVLQAMAAQARTHLNHALKALEALPDAATQIKAQRAGLIMGRVYASLLVEIERSQFAVLNQRISLTPLRKFWLAWRTWVAPHVAVKALHRLANPPLKPAKAV
jgi:15-cis-phytoene synthase